MRIACLSSQRVGAILAAHIKYVKRLGILYRRTLGNLKNQAFCGVRAGSRFLTSARWRPYSAHSSRAATPRHGRQRSASSTSSAGLGRRSCALYRPVLRLGPASSPDLHRHGSLRACGGRAQAAAGDGFAIVGHRLGLAENRFLPANPKPIEIVENHLHMPGPERFVDVFNTQQKPPAIVPRPLKAGQGGERMA